MRQHTGLSIKEADEGLLEWLQFQIGDDSVSNQSQIYGRKVTATDKYLCEPSIVVLNNLISLFLSVIRSVTRRFL